MNVLPFDRQVEVISALVEGCEAAFGIDCDYGQIEKSYSDEPKREAGAALLAWRSSSSRAHAGGRAPKAYFDLVCRTSKLDPADAAAALYTPD